MNRYSFAILICLILGIATIFAIAVILNSNVTAEIQQFQSTGTIWTEVDTNVWRIDIPADGVVCYQFRNGTSCLPASYVRGGIKHGE